MARSDAAKESSNLETSTTGLSALERLGDRLGIVLTLLGVAAYGAMRLSFAAFYRHFGVTPEDVGYDYVGVLTVALPGVVSMLVIVAVLVFGILALLFRGENAKRRRRASTQRARRGVAVLLFAVFGLVFVVVAVVLSVNAAHDAKNGEPVEPTRLLEVALLPWRVDRATVVSLSKDAGEILPNLASTCLMYLGENDGVFVFYDVKSEHAVRLPVSTVAVKTSEDESRC